MSELEMKDDVETEEFTDELSDEALDRAEPPVRQSNCYYPCVCYCSCRLGN
jgi:hypothetical protein